jgi:hypothetical protein
MTEEKVSIMDASGGCGCGIEVGESSYGIAGTGELLAGAPWFEPM